MPGRYGLRLAALVGNWAAVDPAVESVTPDGPFAAGARGQTKPRGLSQVEWRLVKVQPGRGAVIDVALPAAVLMFRWEFEGAGRGHAHQAARDADG